MFGGPSWQGSRRRRQPPLLAALGVLVVALLVAACGRPVPELATTEGRDATGPSAVGVRAVSVETVVPPAPTSSLPTTTIASTPTVAAGTYIVESGDTLSVIAEQFGVSVSALSAANNITDPDSISPGQELIIPES